MADLVSNFSTNIPDAYVLINSIKRSGREYTCFSSTKTSVAHNSFDPEWNEQLRLPISEAEYIVLNVFSKNVALAEDLFLGQAVVDVSKVQSIFLGERAEMCLPIRTASMDVFDTFGRALSIPDAECRGEIKLSIELPSVNMNICGWFVDIKKNFIGVQSQEKIYITLLENEISCFESPHQSHLIRKIFLSDIRICKEVDIDGGGSKTSKGLELTLSDREVLIWEWGDDSRMCKGIWKCALRAL
jgi:hypothetical protein